MKKITTKEAAELLRSRNNFLILTHLRPDGDTLGSAGALCAALRRAGKTAYVLENPETTEKYRFCTDDFVSPSDYEPDFVVSVDIAASNLIPGNAAKYARRIGLSIDHHVTREDFSEYLCCDHTRAACGELVYETIKELLGSVTPGEADLLYTAVSTDTGCFVYGNTNEACLRCAAELVGAGANSPELNRKLFRMKSFARLRLESDIIAGLRLFHGGKVVLAVVTADMVQDENDADDIAAIAGQVDGSVASFTLRELSDGRAKISARSNPNYLDCAAFCAQFGGGGHVAASGATFECGLDEALAIITEKLEKLKI